MTPYARPVVDDVRGRLVHLLDVDQDIDRQIAACGASPFPGRWNPANDAEQTKPWCRTCVTRIRSKR